MVEIMRADKVTSPIQASVPEQNLLLAVLQHNESKILPSYRHELNLQSPESDLRLSFITPITTLLPETLVRLQPLEKCSGCGAASRGSCARCKLVCYCGVDCQRIHWRQHRAMCRKYGSFPNDGEPAEEFCKFDCLFFFGYNRELRVNNRAPSLDDVEIQSGSPDTEDIHNGNLFIVKVQANDREVPIILYDRERSFIGGIVPGHPGYYEVFDIIQANTRWARIKAFIWVRRTDPKSLKFVAALKDLPDQDQSW